MKTTSAELSKLQADLTNLAVKIAAGSNVKLDFSIDSVKQVEKVLDLIHSGYRKDKQEEGIKGIALEFAAYIVSVIEKNLDSGYWERDSEVGRDTSPYHLANGNTIFPYSWCLKRIAIDCKRLAIPAPAPKAVSRKVAKKRTATKKVKSVTKVTRKRQTR